MHLSHPSISVVIACYDQTKELELSLISFLQQTFPNNLYELIVVDDHSPSHDARYIVRTLRKKYPKALLNYVRQYRSDGGVYRSSAKAKNIGLRLAKGEYVFFNNAEIVQAGESLSYIFETFKGSSHPLCLRGVVLDVPFESLVGCTQTELAQLHEQTDRGRERVASADHAGLAAVSRKTLLEVAGNDERFDYWGKEDLDLAARLKRAGVTYKYDENLKSFHISHPANYVKKGDYLRMVALLEENNAFEVTEANLGHLWGTLNNTPVETLEGTVIVEADGQSSDLERRLEETVYSEGAERREAMVVCLEADRPMVEQVLNARFRPITLISISPEDFENAAARLILRVRTRRFFFLSVGGSLAIPIGWEDKDSVSPALLSSCFSFDKAQAAH